jgi:hypothetical protein
LDLWICPTELSLRYPFLNPHTHTHREQIKYPTINSTFLGKKKFTLFPFSLGRLVSKGNVCKICGAKCFVFQESTLVITHHWVRLLLVLSSRASIPRLETHLLRTASCYTGLLEISSLPKSLCKRACAVALQGIFKLAMKTKQ